MTIADKYTIVAELHVDVFRCFEGDVSTGLQKINTAPLFVTLPKTFMRYYTKLTNVT